MLNLKILAGIVSGKLLAADSNDSEAEFECPRCGSSHFGSSAPYGVPETQFICHDEFNRGCSWQGTRDKCFFFTYSKETLAQELLEAYNKIQELEGR